MSSDAGLRLGNVVGEAVTRITRTAMTVGGAHALLKTSPLERP